MWRIRDTHMNVFAVLRGKAKGHMNNLLCRRPRDRLSVFNTALGHFILRDRYGKCGENLKETFIVTITLRGHHEYFTTLRTTRLHYIDYTQYGL